MAEKRVMTFNVPARTREKLEFISNFTGLDFTSIFIAAIDAAYERYAIEKVDRDTGLLDAAEIGELLSANRDMSDAERIALVRWAEEVRAGETLLIGLLMGKFDVHIKDGEPVFTAKEETGGENG